MFTLNWLGRILRPFGVLKRYLLTLIWMIFIAILYFNLHVPVKIDCQLNCSDDSCKKLARSGCPQITAEPQEIDPSQPRRSDRTRQNFIEYLLFHSENGDPEDSPLFFQNEDRGHQEAPRLKLPRKILHLPKGTNATGQPDSQTNSVTDSSRPENISQRERFPPSLKHRTGVVSMNDDTEVIRLDNFTDNVWINNDAGNERTNSGTLQNNETDAISVEYVESGTTSQSISTSKASLGNSAATTLPNIHKSSTSLLNSDTGGILLNITTSTPSQSSVITSSPDERLESQTDLFQTTPKTPASNAGKAENTGSTKTYNSKVQKQKKLGPDLVEKYFEDERKKCAKQDQKAHASTNKYNIGEDDHIHSNDSSSSLMFCPCIPPNLVGRMAVNLSSELSLEDLWESEHQDIEAGGEWQPPHCQSRRRVALIIPYRDRLDHLKTFLRHMLPILKRQLTHFRIFIVEQNEPAMFNKAAMMNIGFMEALKEFQFDCVVFHDVDILMEDDRSLLNCGDQPHHYAISLDRWSYHLKYEAVFGAVISLRPEMFNRTNGFSNSFFGWGGEDDDMGRRVRRFWKVYRPPMEVGRYTTISHKRDAANEVNKDRMKILRNQKSEFARDGINSIRYKVETIQKKPLFTWILANLDVSRLPYPNHASFRYTLSQRAVCTDGKAMSPPRQLSRVTCQYDCDRQKTSCFGYNHRVDGDNRMCWLLTSNCSSFGVVTNQQSSLQTYLKTMKPV